MSTGSNHIWPLVALVSVGSIVAASTFSPIDPLCAATHTASDGRCARATFVDEFEVLDGSVWVSESHFIGKSWLDAAHSSHSDGRLSLVLPAGPHEGSEIRSLRRGLFRDAAARMRVPNARGALVGFFLYQGVRGANDEIDIEIFAGERRIMFTTWSAGVATNHSKHVLPFDPSEDFHDYRIEWSADRVAFLVDGVVYEEFTTGVPSQPMFLMANAWWPHWLSGPELETPESLEIEHFAF